MKKLKITVKGIKEFMKDTKLMYASGAGKIFYIALHAGPNVERYFVMDSTGLTGFRNVGEAVRYFNDLPEE